MKERLELGVCPRLHGKGTDVRITNLSWAMHIFSLEKKKKITLFLTLQPRWALLFFNQNSEPGINIIYYLLWKVFDDVFKTVDSIIQPLHLITLFRKCIKYIIIKKNNNNNTVFLGIKMTASSFQLQLQVLFEFLE